MTLTIKCAAFFSADSVEESATANFPIEFLNSLTPNGMPPHRLSLKKYNSIMLLRNLDPPGGLCNGTRLIVRDFTNRVIDGEIATGVHKGKRVLIPRIILTSSEFELPFILRRKQFPVRMAYCITINKGQGQILKTVGIFLPSPEAIISHGQLYVALSRVTNPRGLKILVSRNTDPCSGGIWVKNIVYREIFNSHYVSDFSQGEDLDELCSLLNETFSSSQLTSPIHPPIKRDCIPLESEPKSKLIILCDFNSETVLPLEIIDDKMETDNDVPDISFGLNECIFNGVIRDPFDFRDDFFNGSVNNLTIEMRVRLANCIGLDVLPILPIRERSCILSNYYTSFQTQLGIFFGHGISIYGTRPDGNCLYRALSHAIFGTENHFSALKRNLINTFISIQEHHFNVMQQSGLLNDQDFHEHIDTISAPN